MNWTLLWEEGTSSPEWSHSGIAVLDDGRVVFSQPGGGGLVLLGPDGTTERVPVPAQHLHGITVARTRAGETLWLADPGYAPEDHPEGRSLDGQVLRWQFATGELSVFPQPRIPSYRERPWRPTSIATTADGVWVADGYGADLVHGFLAGGHLVLHGSPDRAFRCPHGIAIDTRPPVAELVVADRRNRRLVFFGLDGRYSREIVDDAMTSPSSIAVRGQDLIVTELDGALLRVGSDDRVTVIVGDSPKTDRPGWPNVVGPAGPERPRVALGRLNSPHGVAVDDTGDIYLTEWMIGGRQLRLRLPAPAVPDQSGGLGSR